MRIPPLIESVGPRQELLLFSWLFRNRTITVMSSWKCLRTPRSIFFRSEYLISLFFAASCNATLISLLAIPLCYTRVHFGTSVPAKQTASQPSSRILSMRKFEEESKEQVVVYALVPQEFKEAEDVKAVSTPPEIKSLLHDFKDLIAVDLPKELPPIRNIQHVIDLVPGSLLPIYLLTA